MNKPKKTAPKKTATDKQMDAVLRKLLATPPQPHEDSTPKRPPKRPSSRTRGKGG
jgi:hypothetical protein